VTLRQNHGTKEFYGDSGLVFFRARPFSSCRRTTTTTTTTSNCQPPPQLQSQISCRLQKTQTPHYWTSEICGVDSTPLTHLAQRQVHFSPTYPQLHNQPQVPSQSKAFIEILNLQRSTELLHYINFAAKTKLSSVKHQTPTSESLEKHKLLSQSHFPAT